MTVRVNKTIILNNETVNLTDVISNPSKYIASLQSEFNQSTIKQKSFENYEDYLKRLFTLLLKRQIRANSKCLSGLNSHFRILSKGSEDSIIVFKSSNNRYKIKTSNLQSIIDSTKDILGRRLDLTNKYIGVELEFIGNASKLPEFIDSMYRLVGKNNFKYTDFYNHNDGDMWVLGTDMSVKWKRTDNKIKRSQASSFELTSPILSLSSKDDIEMLKSVCDLIKSKLDGYTNQTCGTHIHMSFPVDKALLDDYYASNVEFLRYFAKAYKVSEESLFDKLVPDGRRANHNKYCKSVTLKGIESRYRKLNFRNFTCNSDNLHLEFRQLDGTLNANKILAWTKLQSLFVDNTIESWDMTQDDPQKITLESLLISDTFDNSKDVETLMLMSDFISQESAVI